MFDSNDPFAAELALAKEQPVAGKGGGKRTTFRVKPGPEIQFAKSGVFQFEYENPKNGKKIQKAVQQLKFVIVEGQFYFQQWDRTGDKVKMACTTNKHTVNGKEVVEDVTDPATQAKGVPGTWSIPYDRDETVRRYMPQGSKLHPENGGVLDCATCIANNWNEECGSQGSLSIMVLGWTNDEGDLVDVPGGPFMASLRCPNSSANVFREYARKLYVEREKSPPQVITVANIVPTYNGISNKLDLHAVELAGDELTTEAKSMLEATKTAAAEKREKEYQEWKAKSGGGKGGGNRGGSSTATKSPPPKAGADEDFNF